MGKKKASTVETAQEKQIEQPKECAPVTPTPVVQNEPKYPKELLVKSEAIKSFGLHCDVVRGILIGQEYTIREAKNAIQKYIDSFNR